MKVKGRNGYKGWLTYTPIKNKTYKDKLLNFVTVVECNQKTKVIQSALKEWSKAIFSMTNKEVAVYDSTDQSCVRINVSDEYQMEMDGYNIKFQHTTEPSLCITSTSDKGALYAIFHLLRMIQMELPIESINVTEAPKNQLRMINQWDDMDGSVERGYAGRSIFYKDYDFIRDYERIEDYARLLSSVGINGISINNVNVHQVETKLITDFLPDVAKVADIFRRYGIKTYLSVNFASPVELGDLTTADPLDKAVRDWWKVKVATIYHTIPDFGGFVVKADSEHRPGPFTYGRNHADGSNMLAEALEPFGGIVIWRCFVYNCMQDWRDRSTDRARAAYDHFKPLDGEFHPNVILQIKNGPMDFQVREPVSPLFGAMEKTNQMMEFQIAQEYTGQQRHVCFLVPQWKEVLDFDTYAKGKGSEVKKVIDGSLYNPTLTGITAVSNIGDHDNWCGHQLAQANLYGYGRLSWNPELQSEEIAEDWVRITFGNDENVVAIITSILLQSWRTYEKYTAPLGVGWMVNPNHHYGPNVDGYEYSRWGTYHFADWQGIGVDRTVQSGTGYTSQYFTENRNMYESLEGCPDELLLFFHHVSYTHRLKSGETVIQHIYNTHFEGVEEVKAFKKSWLDLKGKIDNERYETVLDRLNEQVEHAQEWCDVINTYFYRKSGIRDEKNRKIY